MLHLLDGPCEGTYMVKRAPQFLRAVIGLDKNGLGKNDVLDQLTDSPADDELIYIYERITDVGQVHLNMGRGSRSGTGFYAMADYRYLEDVDGTDLRDAEDWRRWCWARVETPV